MDEFDGDTPHYEDQSDNYEDESDDYEDESDGDAPNYEDDPQYYKDKPLKRRVGACLEYNERELVKNEEDLWREKMEKAKANIFKLRDQKVAREAEDDARERAASEKAASTAEAPARPSPQVSMEQVQPVSLFAFCVPAFGTTDRINKNQLGDLAMEDTTAAPPVASSGADRDWPMGDAASDPQAAASISDINQTVSTFAVFVPAIDATIKTHNRLQEFAANDAPMGVVAPVPTIDVTGAYRDEPMGDAVSAPPAVAPLSHLDAVRMAARMLEKPRAPLFAASGSNLDADMEDAAPAPPVAASSSSSNQPVSISVTHSSEWPPYPTSTLCDWTK